MSIQALNLLQAMGLLDSGDRITDLSRFSAADLPSLINYYAEQRLNAAGDELSLTTGGGLSALVSSISGRNAVLPLLPSALVYQTLIVADPLAKLARNDGALARAHRQQLGFAEVPSLEHWQVKNGLAFFQGLAPLMRSGMIVSLPLAGLHRGPVEPLINFSPDWYRSQVPGAVHDYVHKHAIIKELRPGPNGLQVMDEPPRKPVRGIWIEFQGDETVTAGSIYTLQDHEVIEKISDTTYKFAQSLPWDVPPDESLYTAWRYQSVNQTIASRLQAISREIAIAEEIGAGYMTESTFEAGLCAKLGVAADDSAGTVDAVNFLRANEPAIQIGTAQQVLAVRESDPAMFERFYSTLSDAAAQLHGVTDFEAKAKQLFEKDIRPQVDEIEACTRKVVREAVGGAVIGAASLGLAIASGVALPLAAVLGFGAMYATGSSLPSIGEYLDSRRTPAFIWKRLTK